MVSFAYAHIIYMAGVISRLDVDGEEHEPTQQSLEVDNYLRQQAAVMLGHLPTRPSPCVGSQVITSES